MSTDDVGAYLAARIVTMQEKLVRAPWTGPPANVLYHLTGPDGGDWTISVADNRLRLSAGQTAPADVTVTATAADFRMMMAGQLNPAVAFIRGKIRYQGDRELLATLRRLLA